LLAVSLGAGHEADRLGGWLADAAQPVLAKPHARMGQLASNKTRRADVLQITPWGRETNRRVIHAGGAPMTDAVGSICRATSGDHAGLRAAELTYPDTVGRDRLARRHGASLAGRHHHTGLASSQTATSLLRQRSPPPDAPGHDFQISSLDEEK
jgi:hypothetical protein